MTRQAPAETDLPGPSPSVERLCAQLDDSPTPYHAVATAAARLGDAGFEECALRDALPAGPGRRFVVDGGALVAWVHGEGHTAATGVHMIGAHTDSPNLRIKPRPDRRSGQWRQLGVEVYGGVLLNSWLDRDLGLAGRVAVRTADAPGGELRTFRDDRALLRIPQLAIHLDGEIREKGLQLNPQRHLSPVWGLDDGPDFAEYLATMVDVAAGDVLAWDVMAHDLTPAAVAGLGGEFLASARLDNLLSCFVAVEALAEHSGGPHIAMVALFDHEEVGSVSATGAGSPLVGRILDRIAHGLGGDVEDRHRARADSLMVSADGAHATHPNYAERHEPDHHVALNAGPVLKINANQRYATDAATAAVVIGAADRAGVGLQRFVNRTDLACGSTIGPASAAQLGVPVVDVGCAQLAMHSAREMAGCADVAAFEQLLAQFLAG